jgi:chromosome segregation ATPase
MATKLNTNELLEDAVTALYTIANKMIDQDSYFEGTRHIIQSLDRISDSISDLEYSLDKTNKKLENIADEIRIANSSNKEWERELISLEKQLDENDIEIKKTQNKIYRLIKDCNTCSDAEVIEQTDEYKKLEKILELLEKKSESLEWRMNNETGYQS